MSDFDNIVLRFYKKPNNWADMMGDMHSNPTLNPIAEGSLNLLAQSGSIFNMRKAVAAKANLNKNDELGKAPIHEAAFNGQVAMIDFLIDNGANMEAEIKPLGHTALYISIARGYHAMAEMLIARQANCGVKDNITGRGLLHIAVKNNDAVMVQILLKAGLNPEMRDHMGLSARDLAIKLKHAQLIDLLSNY